MPGRDPHPARRLVPVGDPALDADASGSRRGGPGPGSPSSGSPYSWRSRTSLLSAGSFASVLSAGSALSAMSFLSFGSVGSILSIGSSGSILSIGSSGSVLSIGASGGFLQIGSRPNANRPHPRGGRDLSPVVVPLTAAAVALRGRLDELVDRITELRPTA